MENNKSIKETADEERIFNNVLARKKRMLGKLLAAMNVAMDISGATQADKDNIKRGLAISMFIKALSAIDKEMDGSEMLMIKIGRVGLDNIIESAKKEIEKIFGKDCFD